MAFHKSAIKRIKQTAKKQERNRSERTKVKNAVRGFNDAVASGENSQEKLLHAISTLNKAASKGVIPTKRASRKVSRLTKRLNASLG
ncbi:MAG: 30S ribosomal protein S20 [Bradymonadales bacterium]